MKALKKKIISKVKAIIKRDDYLTNASIPDLSFKPDFMIKLEKELIFIEIIYLDKRENVDWKTLRLIEHVFESKLYFGNNLVFNLIILDKNKWKPYCLELIENFFDKVLYEPKINTPKDIYARANQSNFKLWDSERKFVMSRYRDLKESDLKKFRHSEIPCMEFEKTLYKKLVKMDLYPQRNCSIRNLKNYYLRKDLNLRFFFDLCVDNKIVELRSFRRINNSLIQNLLIKARLIRYKKVNQEIVQIPGNRMMLFLNGEIAGPHYDQLRYLRMLTAGGWEVYPITVIKDTKKLKRIFYNAEKKL